jgi:uncharacterized membrane protein
MFRLTLQYIPFSSDAGFLRIKQTQVTGVPPYLSIFYIHVYSSLFVLLAGFTQFSNYLLTSYKWVHRLFGKLYFLIVLFLSAPSGIFMGFYANGAWHTKLSFIILGVLWFLFTAISIVAIKKGQVEKHKAFMTRSFALALSAITLRAWKVVIVHCFNTAPMDTYQIIAWLGWMPNLLIAEYCLINKPRI